MTDNWAEGKIIFSDLDDTFTGEGDEWREKNFAAIKDFISHGGFFTFATGRLNLDDLLPGHREIVNAPVICAQGALVRSLADELLYENFFDCDTAERIKKELEAHFVNEHTGMVLHMTESGDQYYKIVVWSAVENIPVIYEHIHSIFGDEIQYCYPCANLIEFLDPGSTKGSVIKFVSDTVGAKTTYAVGNYLNDVSMLEAADYAACPENAIDTVKNICNGNILCHSAKGAVADLIDRIREDKLK